jgi:hypothetical protein
MDNFAVFDLVIFGCFGWFVELRSFCRETIKEFIKNIFKAPTAHTARCDSYGATNYTVTLQFFGNIHAPFLSVGAL